MIANCLRDYIGLRGCTADEPLSGLYLTDQPGISLISIDKVADSDKQTYQGVWDSLNKRALNTIGLDSISAFSKKYHLKRLTESVKLPQNVDTTDSQTVPSNELRGYSIELQYLSNTTDARSGLQVIHLQEIKMYSAAVVTTDFRIIDVDTFEVLETKSVDLIVGWNTIWTEIDLIAYHVFIGYDASAITSVYLNLPEDSTHGGCACISFCCGDTCGGVIQGGTFDETTDTLETGDNTFGLAGTVSVQCSYETILCNNKSLFKMALFNLLAYELMKERIFTERVNKFTTIDLDKANLMMPEFYEAYQKELQQAVDGIDLNTADCCLVCEAQLQYVETTI